MHILIAGKMQTLCCKNRAWNNSARLTEGGIKSYLGNDKGRHGSDEGPIKIRFILRTTNFVFRKISRTKFPQMLPSQNFCNYNSLYSTKLAELPVGNEETVQTNKRSTLEKTKQKITIVRKQGMPQFELGSTAPARKAERTQRACRRCPTFRAGRTPSILIWVFYRAELFCVLFFIF